MELDYLYTGIKFDIMLQVVCSDDLIRRSYIEERIKRGKYAGKEEEFKKLPPELLDNQIRLFMSEISRSIMLENCKREFDLIVDTSGILMDVRGEMSAGS